MRLFGLVDSVVNTLDRPFWMGEIFARAAGGSTAVSWLNLAAPGESASWLNLAAPITAPAWLNLGAPAGSSPWTNLARTAKRRLRLFGKVDGQIDRQDWPHVYGLPFTSPGTGGTSRWLTLPAPTSPTVWRHA